jgi:hypothetical protein
MLRTLSVLLFLLGLPAGANADKLRVEIDGYKAGEVSFNDAFSRTQDGTKRQIFNAILDTLVSAEANPSAGKFVALLIIGHSDRQDNTQQFPTAEARRLSELQASIDRAVTAEEQITELVKSRLRALGVTPTANFRNIAIARAVGGASDLKQSAITSEVQRLQNRRVGLFTQTFPKD